MPQPDFRRSAVYYQAASKADAWAFYMDCFACLLVVQVNSGWQALAHVSQRRWIFPITALALATRGTQLLRPLAYWRWRFTLMRISRCLKLLGSLSFLPTLHTLHSQGLLTPALLEATFAPTPPFTTSARYTTVTLLIASGASSGLTTLERILPFPEQLTLQLVRLAATLTFLTPPAISAFSLPSFRPSCQTLCDALTTFAFLNPLVLLVSAERRKCIMPPPCSEAAPVHLVLFTQIFVLFFVPTYISFQFERRLRNRFLDQIRQLAAARQQPKDGRPLCLQHQAPLWTRAKQVAVDVAVLLYLAAVTWRCVVAYDKQILAAVVWLRQVAGVAAADGLQQQRSGIEHYAEHQALRRCGQRNL